MKKLIAVLFVLGFLGIFGQAEAVGAPYIYSANATNITSTSAKLNGVVNPNGGNTNAWFELSSNNSDLGYQNVGSGNSNVTMTPYTVTGLTPNTSYQFHVVAQNNYGNTVSSWVFFTTLPYNNPPPPPPSDPLPSVDLYANNTNIPYNSGTTLNWDTYEADTCNGSGGANGWAGYKNPNGGTFYTGNLVQTTTFSITCSNNSGSDSDSVTIYVGSAPTPSPTVNLTAEDTNISYNSATNLSWTSTNATSCNATGGANGWAGARPTSGTFYTGNLTSTKTYTLTCTGSGGSATDSVTVYVGSAPTPSPTVNLTANPTNINYNGNSTLSWTSTNATSCNATGGANGWAGPKNTSGTFYTGNLVNTTTYTLTCTGSGGSATDSVTVYVGSAPLPTPTVNITANQNYVQYGMGTTLSWSSTNATSCEGTGGANGWVGAKHLNGTFYTGDLSQTTTFNITCSNGSGSATDSVTVYINHNNNDTNPNITTNNATNVDENSARLNGYVNSNGGNVTVWFEWGENSSMNNTTNQQYLGETNGSDFSSSLFNLDTNQTHYFRAVARNQNGQTIYGATKTFSTGNDNNDRPKVSTDSATNISTTSATLNGELEEINDTEAEVWFEYDTNRNNLEDGDGDDTRRQDMDEEDDFDARITGLRRNTTYYFRAVARNDHGTDYGSIRSFRTDDNGTVLGSCFGNTCAPQAVTTLATNIDYNSARLNGLGLVPNNAYTTGYFEWGSTPALGNTTSQTSIGNSNSNNFYSSLFNLSSGTTYYYRAVATNQYGISRGDIVSFRTGNRTVVNNPNPTIIYRNTTVVENNTNNNNAGLSRPSLVFLDVNRDDEIIYTGDVMDYTITYQNISDEYLTNVVLQISLPSELEFLQTSRGEISLDNNIVLVDIGDLEPGEAGNVTVTAGVRTDAFIGKTIVITANLAYTIVDTDEQEEVFAYSKNTIDQGGNVLGASTFWGAGFWPNSLLGWLLLLLLILLIIWIARRAYTDRKAPTNHTTHNYYPYGVPPEQKNSNAGEPPHNIPF